MRKLLLVLTLLGVSVFMLGAGVSTASAANCSVRITTPDYVAGISPGYIFSYAGFYNCTDVSAVRWKYSANFTADGAGFNDVTANAWAGPGKNGDAFCDSPCSGYGGLIAADFTKNAPFGSHCTNGVGNCDRIIAVHCWWYGDATRQVWAFWTYQIKGAASGTWGVLHSTSSATVNVRVGKVGSC